MKKSIYLGIIALATLSLASCAKDEVVESVPQAEAIEFGTYLGHDVQSRGMELTNTNFDNFGVFAFYTGNGETNKWANVKSTAKPNFMYNQSVTKNTSGTHAWSYSPKKYWPTTKGDQITFFAYAPMASNDNGISVTKNTATGTPVVTYSIVSQKLNKLGDFVADALIDQTKAGDNSSIDSKNHTVSFTLLHELTRVAITAQLDRDAWSDTDGSADKTQINIKSITLTGPSTNNELYTNADYTFANKNDSEATAPATVIRGTWSNFKTAESLKIDSPLFNSGNVTIGDYTETGVIISSHEDNNNDTDKPVKLFGDDNYLFLIPTDNDGISKTGNVQLVVEYDIVTVDEALSLKYSVTSAKKIIDLPAGILKQGTAYNLNLTFGLNEIILDASITNWETGTDNNQNVDWPKTDATN